MSFAAHLLPLNHPAPDAHLLEPPVLPRYGQLTSHPIAAIPPLSHLTPRPEPAYLRTPPVMEFPTGSLEPMGGFVPTPYTEAEAPYEEAIEEALPRRLDPIFGYLLFWALGLGTLPLAPETRHLLMWLVLLALGLILTVVDTNRPVGPIRSVNLTWGVGLGFIVGLPLLITTASGLAQVSAALFPYTNFASLFQALVFIGPMAETLFYRGVMQDERGLVTGALSAGLGSLILYWPAASSGVALLVIAVTISTALAAVFGYVRTRYGLAAAYASQVMTNLMLLFIPRLLAG